MDLLHLLQLDDYLEKWRDIKDVLQKGGNPNEISSDDGVCAMHVAAGLGEKATSLLLQYGGCPNIESVDGTAPLHVAASWGCKSAIVILLQHGADRMQQDENGKIPYDLALEGGYSDCALLLEPSHSLSSEQPLCRDQSFPDLTSPNSSSQTITHKLHKYLEEGTPFHFDVTSPDSPCVRRKHAHSSPSRQRRNYFDSICSLKSRPCVKILASESDRSCSQCSCSSSSINFVGNECIANHSCRTQPSHCISNFCAELQSGLRPSSGYVCGAHHHQLNSSPQAVSSCSRKFSEWHHACDCANNHNFHPSSFSPHMLSNNQSHSCLCKSHGYSSLRSVADSNLNSRSCCSPVKRSDSNRKVQPVKPLCLNSRDDSYGFDAPVYDNRCRIGLSSDSPTGSESSYSSFPMSAYSSTLASSVASPRDKVAAFVLSSADFMSQCSMKEKENITANFQQGVDSNSVLNDSDSHGEQTVSDSSVNTFETCSESPCVEQLVNEKEEKLHLTCKSKDKADIESKDIRLKTSQPKWKPPNHHIALNASDIITSDDSFMSHRSPRVYRMKTRQVNMGKRVDSPRMETKSKIFTSMPPPNVPKIKTSVPEDYKSDDSLFSVVSTKEVVVKDEKSGIVLIEKHTPSVTGGSVGRRSLDSISITSAATVDSQATLIYDWHTLGRIYKQDKSDSSKHLYTRKPLAQLRKENGTSDNKVLSSQSSSGSSNDIISPSLHTQDTIPDCEIPDHLSKLSCEEISQRLQQYGELPGPIITSTKQVYLKRLTSLEANPGLISLSSKTPDFPPELRQALEGKFDASHLPMIEAKMVEEFSAASSSNKQWREGTVKSSFTYLLLDPRVSANLPLRAKEMTDLEVFKTFICSIFYIGKGKRARPYCHLHEAVRQMNKANANNSCKSNKKVEQVIEIWKAGLGVVSLHCFQSVIPVEAYTREACMIEAIGIHKLTNIKRGDFYGVSSTWSMQLRRQVGVYLLQKALQIFLADGERQICLPDLCT